MRIVKIIFYNYKELFKTKNYREQMKWTIRFLLMIQQSMSGKYYLLFMKHFKLNWPSMVHGTCARYGRVPPNQCKEEFFFRSQLGFSSHPHVSTRKEA